MESSGNGGKGNGKGPGTSTDPGSQLAGPVGEVVMGLRVFGTNVEHDFPIGGFKQIWVGRDPGGTDEPVIRIDHETVSRRHASIEWQGPHLVIVDHASKNHTRHTRGEGQPQGVFHLLPGAVVKFGAVEMVAYSHRTQKIRAGFRRFLGYGDAAQPTVETVQHGATFRHHVALVGKPGSGAPALARFIHRTSVTNTWPFEMPDKVPADDAEQQRALVSRAAYGTLVLEARNKNVRAEKLRRLFDLVADDAFHVRLVVLAEPGSNLEKIVGERVRGKLDLVPVPSLDVRGDELRQVIAETVAHHCAEQGAASGLLHLEDAAQLVALATPRGRGGLGKITTNDDLEDLVARLVLVRKHESANEAERLLGMSRGSLSKWARKWGFALGPPGRPPAR